jgi:hypothetical protein
LIDLLRLGAVDTVLVKQDMEFDSGKLEEGAADAAIASTGSPSKAMGLACAPASPSELTIFIFVD